MLDSPRGRLLRQCALAYSWAIANPGKIYQVTSPNQQASDQYREVMLHQHGSIPDNITFHSTENRDVEGRPAR